MFYLVQFDDFFVVEYIHVDVLIMQLYNNDIFLLLNM
jgi:hypothetical protein